MNVFPKISRFGLATMIIQFTPLRALLIAFVFINCIILLFSLNRLSIPKYSIFRSSTNSTHAKATYIEPAAYEQIDLECRIVEQLNKDGIAIILKTGAQDVPSLSIHFSTTLRCFEPEDILIFSDLEQNVGQFHLHDSLRAVNETIKKNNPDFEIYRTIHHYNATGQDVSTLKEDHNKGDGRAGWKLDKYKFLHMIEDTYEMRPDANWYVFIETDTYVLWPNLVHWLQRFDFSKPSYIGAAVMVGPQVFAHGGTGYVISKASMKMLMADDKDHHLSAYWDKEIEGWCCGDGGLGKSLQDTGTPVSNGRPWLSGEGPSRMEYGKGHWCEPLVTMHHLSPDEISNIWRYQRQREDQEHNLSPILYKDIHNSFLLPQIPKFQDKWDNLSGGKRIGPPKPPDKDKDKASDTKSNPAIKRADSNSNPPPNHDSSASHSDSNHEPRTNFESEKPHFRKRFLSKRDAPDPTKDAYLSFNHCKKVCEADKNCFQYSFTNAPGQKEIGECVLGGEQMWIWGKYSEGTRSGWVVERIRDWVDKEENKCTTPAWG